jgi:hypothetical protein
MVDTMKLSPDERAARMEQAGKLWRNGDMVDNRKTELLRVLLVESMEVLPREALERFKVDPTYFESHIRHRMGKRWGLALRAGAAVSKAMKSKLSCLHNLLDDNQIEEARLKFLSSDVHDFAAFKVALCMMTHKV